jgi:hypothetical protein
MFDFIETFLLPVAFSTTNKPGQFIHALLGRHLPSDEELKRNGDRLLLADC